MFQFQIFLSTKIPCSKLGKTLLLWKYRFKTNDWQHEGYQNADFKCAKLVPHNEKHYLPIAKMFIGLQIQTNVTIDFKHQMKKKKLLKNKLVYFIKLLNVKFRQIVDWFANCGVPFSHGCLFCSSSAWFLATGTGLDDLPTSCCFRDGVRNFRDAHRTPRTLGKLRWPYCFVRLPSYESNTSNRIQVT